MHSAAIAELQLESGRGVRRIQANAGGVRRRLGDGDVHRGNRNAGQDKKG